MEEITVQELVVKLNESNIQLVDVREPAEIALAYIPGFQVFPLSDYAKWSSQIKTVLNQTEETLVICHHGIRSAQMCHWLRSVGFTNVKNIRGGIDAYSLLVDANIPRY